MILVLGEIRWRLQPMNGVRGAWGYFKASRTYHISQVFDSLHEMSTLLNLSLTSAFLSNVIFFST